MSRLSVTSDFYPVCAVFFFHLLTVLPTDCTSHGVPGKHGQHYRPCVSVHYSLSSSSVALPKNYHVIELVHPCRACGSSAFLWATCQARKLSWKGRRRIIGRRSRAIREITMNCLCTTVRPQSRWGYLAARNRVRKDRLFPLTT